MAKIKNGKSPDLCKEKDCLLPRYQPGKTRYSYCEAHQLALWAKYATNDDDQQESWRTRSAARRDQFPNGSRPAEVPANTGSQCAMCHRTPQDAAVFALHGRAWCCTCTPAGTSRDDLLRRLVPAQPIALPLTNHSSDIETLKIQVAELQLQIDLSKPDANELRSLRLERDQLLSDLADANRQIDTLRETIQNGRDAQELPASPTSYKIVIVDYGENQLRYLICDQHHTQSMPYTERELLDQLEKDVANGFLVTHSPMTEVAI